MSSEHSEVSDVLRKHTREPSSYWYDGLFTLTYCDLQVSGSTVPAHFSKVWPVRVLQELNYAAAAFKYHLQKWWEDQLRLYF